MNAPKTLWLGSYSEYVLDAHGVEKRVRRQITLSSTKKGANNVTKREAQRLLQPYLDRVNSGIATPARERKSATFEAFCDIWQRDYLSLCKTRPRSKSPGAT